MHKYIIDTNEKLAALCAELSAHSVIAIDTEFLREKTYYAQLCLIQLATEAHIICVDPLACSELQPLLDVLYDPARVKVLHSARQDLELFYDLVGHLPQNIFDTQIAATLLGHGDQIGYAKLVKKMVGVDLDKAHTRTDWSRRPLSKEQVEYALDDVRYLLQIYHEQKDALAKAGRSDWLQRDFAALSDNATYANPDATLWQRLRGSNILKGVQLCVLQALAIWRETNARQKNRPRRWILRDEILIDLARFMPVTHEQANKIRGLDAGSARQLDAILPLIEKAKQLPPEQWPAQPKYTPLTPAQEALVDIFMAMVKLRAESNLISTNVLASRKDLEAVVLGKQATAVMTGWRYQLVGKDIDDFMQGRNRLGMQDGQVSIIPETTE